MTQLIQYRSTKIVHFLSNHKDTETLKMLLEMEFGLDKNGNPFDFQVVVIPHPLLKGDWSTQSIKYHCWRQIAAAVDAETLIANGDYTLIAIITLQRHENGKRTGFIGMDKLSDQDGATKLENGTIKHQNLLKPVSIRWV